MHSVHFAIRRTFHKSWARGMAITSRYGLTPTRVDILHAIRQLHGQGLGQRELRRRLGISSSVLSRLLKKLERCGLIFRRVSPLDRRRVDILLTRLGAQLIERFFREVIHPGVARRDVETFMSAGKGEEHTQRATVEAFRRQLLKVRRYLGDTGVVRYGEPPVRAPGDVRPLEELQADQDAADIDEALDDCVLPDGTFWIPPEQAPASIESPLDLMLQGGVSGVKEGWLEEQEVMSNKLTR